ncbi:MAG: hypothetical protein JWP60_2959, partial [Ramlibacter sp.]|nr:hypothetical protein [Ramlibacter sp.]
LAPIGKWVMENRADIEETRERGREQIRGDIAAAPD